MSTYLTAAAKDCVEGLAFLQLQYIFNQKAFESNMITKAMHDYARDSIQKSIDIMSRECYNTPKQSNTL